jgi:hypothetical protein
MRSKPFSFFEVVPIRFTDLNLLYANACYLCGSFDHPDSLLFCSCCFESYHPTCLIPPAKELQFASKVNLAIIKSKNGQWSCPKCRICIHCHQGPKTHDNLYCSYCDRLFHVSCIYKGFIFTSDTNRPDLGIFLKYAY